MDSNHRPPRPERGALATALHPDEYYYYKPIGDGIDRPRLSLTPRCLSATFLDRVPVVG